MKVKHEVDADDLIGAVQYPLNELLDIYDSNKKDDIERRKDLLRDAQDALDDMARALIKYACFADDVQGELKDMITYDIDDYLYEALDK